MKREISLSALRWPRVEAIGKMQSRSFSRRGRDVGSREERGGEGLKGESAVGNVDGVLCVKGESASVVADGGLVEEKNVIGACAGGDWQRRRRGAELAAPVAEGEMGDGCACGEKTDGGVK